MASSNANQGILRAPVFDTDELPDVSARHLRLPIAEVTQTATAEATISTEPTIHLEDENQADTEDNEKDVVETGPAPAEGSVALGAASTKPASPKRKKKCNFWANEKPRHRIKGGRSAVAKRVKADLDPEDRIIMQMKLKGFKDAAIKQRLIDENRINYQEKSISTRWSRIQRVLHAHETKMLDDELSDWHEGDDDILDHAIEFHREQYEDEKKAAEDRHWKRVAEEMKKAMSEPRFSKNACRDRHNAREAGTAQKPLELDSDQEGRAKQRADRTALRARQRAQAAERAAREAEEARREEEAKELEEQQKESKKAGKRAVREQKRAEQQSVKDQHQVERQKKAELKKQEQAEKDRETIEKYKANHKTKQSKKAEKAAKTAARRQAADEKKRLKAQEAVNKQNAALAEKEAKLKALKEQEVHNDILHEFMGPAITGVEDAASASDDSLSDEQILKRRKVNRRGGKVAGSKAGKKQKGRDNSIRVDKGNKGIADADKTDQDDEEVKPEDLFLENGNVPKFPAPVVFATHQETKNSDASGPSIAARKDMTIEQLQAVAKSRNVTVLGDKLNVLRCLASADNTFTKAHLAELLNKRKLPRTGTKTELISRLAKDDAGLLGQKGSDFYEKVVAEVTAKQQPRYETSKRQAPSDVLTGPNQKVQKMNASGDVRSADACDEAQSSTEIGAHYDPVKHTVAKNESVLGGLDGTDEQIEDYRPEINFLAEIGAHLNNVRLENTNVELQIEGLEDVPAQIDPDLEVALDRPNKLPDHIHLDSGIFDFE